MSNNTTAARKEYLREYHREWRKKNPDKVKANLERYWIRKAEQIRTRAANQDPEQRSGCAAE